ncbi:MAG: hypothetical protein K5776_06855 [Lachnospiraceae bacterium]|nr:hypothetical protein [Lachnospiraceae bacterium]
MYDFIPVVCGVVVFILGLIMSLNPKGSTRKDLRDDNKAVAKTRTSGIVMAFLGVVLLILGIIRIVMF